METTFDKFITNNPKERELFEQKYNEFLLSEFILEKMELEKMEEEKISVKALAQKAGVSPTVSHNEQFALRG